MGPSRRDTGVSRATSTFASPIFISQLHHSTLGRCSRSRSYHRCLNLMPCTWKLSSHHAFMASVGIPGGVVSIERVQILCYALRPIGRVFMNISLRHSGRVLGDLRHSGRVWDLRHGGRVTLFLIISNFSCCQLKHALHLVGSVAHVVTVIKCECLNSIAIAEAIIEDGPRRSTAAYHYRPQ